MIQRIQSVWLLVAGLLALATYKLAYWSSTLKDSSVKKLYAHTSDSLMIYLAVILLVIVSFATIALFKNRPLQSRLCLLGIVVSIGLLIMEVRETADEKVSPLYTEGSWQIGIILPLLIIVALILAMRGIRRDQKLVKSLDRLR
jgi:hypothetical protein